jgi:hypothetical protein
MKKQCLTRPYPHKTVSTHTLLNTHTITHTQHTQHTHMTHYTHPLPFLFQIHTLHPTHTPQAHTRTHRTHARTYPDCRLNTSKDGMLTFTVGDTTHSRTVDDIAVARASRRIEFSVCLLCNVMLCNVEFFLFVLFIYFSFYFSFYYCYFHNA